MDKKEQTRLRVQRYRKRQNSVTLPEALQSDVVHYPALLYALSDPIKRNKLRRISEELNKAHQLENVFYGCKSWIPFSVVSEYLTALD